MKDLVEQMLDAFQVGNHSQAWVTRMTAAARVCLDAALGDVDDEEWKKFFERAVNHKHLDFADVNAFLVNRRARLLAPKTVEERVTVHSCNRSNAHVPDWEVRVDGQLKVTLSYLDGKEVAETYRKGLIAEIKEREG